MSEESDRLITKEGVVGYLLIVGFAVLIVLVLALIAGVFMSASIPPNLD